MICYVFLYLFAAYTVLLHHSLPPGRLLIVLRPASVGLYQRCTQSMPWPSSNDLSETEPGFKKRMKLEQHEDA